MSTKAHIFNNEYIEAYAETSEHIIVFGKHKGWKTYILLSNGDTWVNYYNPDIASEHKTTKELREFWIENIYGK